MNITVIEAGTAARRSLTALPFPAGSMLWKLIVPAFVAVAALVVAVAIFTPSAIIDDAINHAIVKDAITARELKTLRAYYSSNVVSNAVKSGVLASPSFQDHPGAIPVPTTFLLEVAHAFNSPDMKLDLVSPYPWPTRAFRKLDEFQKQAWDYLSTHPDARFVKRDVQDGNEVLRVAIADRMDESCVACHNSSPTSPKKDWKIGDVRGIIEVTTPLHAISQGAHQLALKLTAGIILAGLVLLATLAAIGLHLLRPLRDLTRIIHQIAVGRELSVVPHITRSDELGTVARAVSFLQDQTKLRGIAEAKIRHLAEHDALTGLGNRAAFIDRVSAVLDDAKQDAAYAVLYLDLDRFKAVNDTMGHPVGDRLLVEVAKRINRCIAPGDFAARLGGDEFCVFQKEVMQPYGSSRLAEQLLSVLQQPYDLDGHLVIVGTSVGIALAPANGKEIDGLLKNADLALYRAKSDGRGVFRFFEADMDARMQDRRALEVALRSAVLNEEFEVYYQPLVRLSDNTISCFEALLRWHHPGRGMVSPGEFIPLAEEIGVIPTIGAWVLEAACKEATNWPQDIRVAVNLSPLQFRQKTLVSDVISALNRSGLSPHRLELEITESALLSDTGDTLSALHTLRDLGVRISMDDFGTGYSSLGYLQKFPFDKIKIDQSFIRGVSETPNSLAIVRAITGLGASLGMTTTAEGIETEEQLRTVRDEGCSEIQGYLVSRPRRAEELAMLLQGFPRNRSIQKMSSS